MATAFYYYIDTDYRDMSAAVALLVIGVSIVYYSIKTWNILPGPKGVPYFGIYPFLIHETCHLQLEEYGKKYGDVYSFRSFGKLVINLGSAQAIKEAHVAKSNCFEKRFETFNIMGYVFKEALLFSSGEPWKILRKFFAQSFREYGLTTMRGKAAEAIDASIASTVQVINSCEGQPLDVFELLIDKCTLTPRRALFGDAISDERIVSIARAYACLLSEMTGAKQLMLGPVGKLLFKTLPRYRQAIQHNREMCSMLTEVVQDIKSAMNEDHATCIVEEFYQEKRLRRQKNDPAWEYFSDRALIVSLSQFVGDGILDAAFFVYAFLHALAEHPEEQEKIYQELMDAVGPNRLPTAEDRSNLRYTDAFMHEVLRTSSNLITQFLSMECTKDTTLRGYRIPKGSLTLLNVWQAHHDSNTYNEPHKFNPSRFLVQERTLVSFGLGKRSCIGEQFIMLTSFIYLTSIVLHFTISVPSQDEHPKSLSQFMLSFHHRRKE